MTLTTVILLILIGLLIILAEIFFVPGSTFVGVIGVLLIVAGLVGAFYSLDRPTGFGVLGATLVLLAFLTFLGFKTKTWQRFAVKSAIDGRAPADAIKFREGQEGITLTRCTPIGKVQFENGIEEVYSANDYIEANVSVVISKIQDNKIIVKTKTPVV